MNTCIDIPFDKLEENTGLIHEDNKVHKLILSKKEFYFIPQGTYFRMAQIIVKNRFCKVGYLSEHRLWYILSGKRILWTNFRIKIKSDSVSLTKEKPKPNKFNRYTALLRK